MTDHGQTVYDTHHAVMHEQVGRRGSHHKAYEDLTPKVRARYMVAGQAVAGPLEAENAHLRALLGEVLDDLERVVSGNSDYVDRAVLEAYRERAETITEGRVMTTQTEHQCVFAPGLPGLCECGNTYAAEQVKQALSGYLAERAGGYVTAPMVQRKVRVGYARAAYLLDALARDGEISDPDSRGRYTVPPAPPSATETTTEGNDLAGL